MSNVVIADLNHPLLDLGFGSVLGTGKVVPRLSFTLTARVVSTQTWISLQYLAPRLYLGTELLGFGVVGTTGIFGSEEATARSLAIEFPIPPKALAFIDQHLVDTDLDLALDFSGQLFRHPKADLTTVPAFPSDGWDAVGVHLGTSNKLSCRVARSTWFTQVVAPLGIDQYVPVEIRIPAGALGDEFRKAVGQIEQAEHAFAQGDDPSTFLRCKGALDALPGAKKQIYSGLSDVPKRNAIDALTKALGDYLHSGRHVADGGEAKGDFPVDHRDAAFVLSATKLVVAYAGQLLEGLAASPG